MAAMVMSYKKKAGHGEGLVLKEIDGLPTCGGRAWYSLRIRTRSLYHVEKHHPPNGLLNVAPPYPHHQTNAG